MALIKQLANRLNFKLPGRGHKTILKERAFSHLILVGTYHKTGTVWMNTIFREIALEFNLRFSYGHDQISPSGVDIIFDNHSGFELKTLPIDYRGLHVIRDPRDLILSGCFYHQKSNEAWLHKPKAKFGDSTYQEKINSYASFDDKLLFEMEQMGKSTVQKMLKWDYENPNFFEVKYENLINDTDLLLFHQIFTFLGFSGQTIPRILEIAHKNSLFSYNIPKSVHVRSGESGSGNNILTPSIDVALLNSSVTP